MEIHLVRTNIVRLKAPLNYHNMTEFVAFLAPVNQFIEKRKGFVWQLKDEQSRTATYIESPFKNEMMAMGIHRKT
ncbi:MAG: DUF3291 domain-containing protein [Bacteroidota bacterium]